MAHVNPYFRYGKKLPTSPFTKLTMPSRKIHRDTGPRAVYTAHVASAQPPCSAAAPLAARVLVPYLGKAEPGTVEERKSVNMWFKKRQETGSKLGKRRTIGIPTYSKH